MNSSTVLPSSVSGVHASFQTPSNVYSICSPSGLCVALRIKYTVPLRDLGFLFNCRCRNQHSLLWHQWTPKSPQNESWLLLFAVCTKSFNASWWRTTASRDKRESYMNWALMLRSFQISNLESWRDRLRLLQKQLGTFLESYGTFLRALIFGLQTASLARVAAQENISIPKDLEFAELRFRLMLSMDEVSQRGKVQFAA